MPASSSATRPASEEPPEQLTRMSFGDHLEDLRRRLIVSLLGVFVAVSFCLWHIYAIVNFLVHPYRVALQCAGYPDTLTWQKPAEVVILYLNLGLKAGLILASPWIIYQLWRFIAAGLFRRERILVYKYIGPSILLFLAGIVFFFFFVLPITLRFFIGFADETGAPPPRPWPLERMLIGPASPTGLTHATLPSGDERRFEIPVVRSDPTTIPADRMLLWFNAVEGKLKARAGVKSYSFPLTHTNSLFTPLPSLDDYLSFVTFMALLFGVSFEMPMVMMILAQIGIVSAGAFRRGWRIAYFTCAVVAMIACPTPDPLTMLCLLIPLVGLYELGILLAKITTRHRQEVEAVE